MNQTTNIVIQGKTFISVLCDFLFAFLKNVKKKNTRCTVLNIDLHFIGQSSCACFLLLHKRKHF